MSATYDPTLPNDRNFVRFLINDTVTSTAIFQDEEIDAVLTEESARISVAAALKYFAAARLIDRLHLQLAAGGTKHGGAMSKRVEDLARSFGVAASTSAALDEKARDLRREGARRLRTSRGFFFRAMAVTALLIGDPSGGVAQTIYSWLPFLPPVANSAALPACSDNTLTERRMITTLSPSPGSLYICPDGGGAWACLVGQDCPSTGSVTSVGLTMPSGFTVTGSPVTGSGTLAATITGTLTANISGNATTATTASNVADNSVALGTKTTGGYAGSASEGGPATTALAFDANPTACDVGEFVTDIAADGTLTCDAVSPGVTDHGALTGLSDDDHSQYTLLAGRGSGQSLTGAVGTTGYLKFNAHSGDGGGSIYFSSAVNTDTGTIRLVYGGSGIYNGAMYNYGKGTHFVTCAGLGGGAGMIGCTDDNDHYVVSRGFVVSTDGTFPGVAIRGANSSASGVSNQFFGLQMASDTKIGWVNATNLTFSPTADLLIDRDRASMFRISSTTDGTGGATLLIVPTDTAPTCNKKGIQWERSSVDALCRCNGSTWDKLAGAGSCP